MSRGVAAKSDHLLPSALYKDAPVRSAYLISQQGFFLTSQDLLKP
jgi:hypothetical protein